MFNVRFLTVENLYKLRTEKIIRGCVELVLTLTFLASEFDSAKLEEHRVRGKTP